MIPDGPLFEVAVVRHTGCGTGFLADASFRSAFAARTGLDAAMLAAEAVVDPAVTVRTNVDRLLSSPKCCRRSASRVTSATSRPDWSPPSSTQHSRMHKALSRCARYRRGTPADPPRHEDHAPGRAPGRVPSRLVHTRRARTASRAWRRVSLLAFGVAESGLGGAKRLHLLVGVAAA